MRREEIRDLKGDLHDPWCLVHEELGAGRLMSGRGLRERSRSLSGQGVHRSLQINRATAHGGRSGKGVLGKGLKNPRTIFVMLPGAVWHAGAVRGGPRVGLTVEALTLTGVRGLGGGGMPSSPELTTEASNSIRVVPCSRAWQDIRINMSPLRISDTIFTLSTRRDFNWAHASQESTLVMLNSTDELYITQVDLVILSLLIFHS